MEWKEREGEVLKPPKVNFLVTSLRLLGVGHNNKDVATLPQSVDLWLRFSADR